MRKKADVTMVATGDQVRPMVDGADEVTVRVNPVLAQGCAGAVRVGKRTFRAHQDIVISESVWNELKDVKIGKHAVLIKQ